MILFEIGGTDLTKHIVVPTYKVNSTHVAKKWTDANHVEHMRILREQVVGEFKMRFTRKDKYLEVLKLFEQNEDIYGYTPVRLYVNNLDVVASISAFLNLTPADTMPLFGVKDYDGFMVDVRER